ncbi:MAG TPA: DUF5916 domain-containing protein [Vicinamibacterales bacterium]|nr:DUF5916 domain-containing protein [Vicinamibacterales bacterium]
MAASLLAILPSVSGAQEHPPVSARQRPDGGLPPIDGPPPPPPPATVARDERGRVTLRAVRLDGPLRLDGRLDEEIYRRVLPASDFIQQEPHEGRPATERTEAWVFFDDEALYVAARCRDSRPDRIVATELRRDHFNIFQNDNFTVVLDTFYDRRNGFFFQINPLGALRDQSFSDERTNNNDWNTVWEGRAARFDGGWSLEIRVPFKSLRYRGAGPQVWGINLRRIVRWKNEHAFLAPVAAAHSFRGIYRMSSAATLVGLETPRESLNLEVKPYALGSVTTDRQAVPPFSDRPDASAGVDVKYGLTRGLVADVTINTDFAQVEEDEQQVNLTRFSLFFPEKREFFLEGQTIFAFGGQETGGPRGAAAVSMVRPPSNTPVLFFSRRIGLAEGRLVPIRGGGRVTGRAGPYTLGALAIRTGRAAEVGAEPTTFGVLRIKRDILRRSYVGLLVTHRSPSAAGTGSNVAAGLDVNLALLETLTVTAYAAGTRTTGPAGEAPDAPSSAVPRGAVRQGASYRAQLEYNGDRYGLELERLVVGEGFDPQVGFLRRGDFRRSFAEARFSPRPRAGPIRKIFYEAGLDYTTDTAGRLETREARGTFRLEFHSSDQFSVDYARSYEFVETPFPLGRGVAVAAGGYRFRTVGAEYLLGPQRRLSGRLSARRGGFFGGRQAGGGATLRAELTPRLAVEPRVSIDRLDLPAGRLTAAVGAMRVIATFTPRMAATVLVQYNSTTRALGASARFRWEYRPGSDLFVVFTDGRQADGGGFPRLVNRTFAVKLTRLVRF